MARRRMLDPEFFFDEELATSENSAYLRLFYQGLWCHCDDIFHTLPYKAGWLKANIFPYEQVDVEKLWKELVDLGKLVEFTEEGQKFGWLKNFNKFQRIDKPSRSKYPEYSGSTPGGLQESSGSPPAKEKLSKEKLIEVKEVAGAPPIPVFERKIREKDAEYRELVKDLAAKDYLTPVRINEVVLSEFLPHWLERSEGAKKARWEKEKAFQYTKRISTWITNYHKFAKDYTCSLKIWHRKGETCHHKEPEPDYKHVGVSEYAKAIVKRV